MSEIKREGRKSAKTSVNGEDGRRRRMDVTVKLRKDKKDENLAKRRFVGIVAEKSISTGMDDADLDNSNLSGASEEISDFIGAQVYSVADIPTLCSILQKSDSDLSQIIETVRAFRKMLSQELNPPIQEVIESGVLPIFVQLLSRSDCEELQFEAAWALTNVASTDHTRLVAHIGTIEPLVTLLLSPSADVREQSVWCLGNIAGDCPELRDDVLQAGALFPMLQNVAHPANDSLLGNCVWALSNFCRGKPQPCLDVVGAALPALAHLIEHPNKNIVMDGCWALSYLSDGDDDRIQAVIDVGVIPTLCAFLGHSSSGLITPALRTIGNIVSGNDKQTQTVINNGALHHVKTLLTHNKKNIRKETCWLLSNIAAGSKDQINILLGMPRELSRVIALIRGAEWEVRKEAVWVVSNIATGGSELHVQAIAELGAIDSLCAMLTVSDPKIIMVALDALEAILKVGDKFGKSYDCLIDEADGLEKIEGLQDHENDHIYSKAVHILEQFYGGESDEDENLAPAANADSFAFGVQKPSQAKAFGAFDGKKPSQPMHQSFNFS